MPQVRVRIAPSPTGVAHVGTAYVSLFNYAFAKQKNGKFILRVEDTDIRRNIKKAERIIFSALKWLGLEYDEGPDIGGPFSPYRQSERLDIYKRYVKTLLDQGRAYYCFCSPERLAAVRKRQQREKKPPMYDGCCRKMNVEEAEERVKAGQKHVVRLKVPTTGETKWDDLVRGQIIFQNATIGDFVILKSNGYPTYNFAVVVDDVEMEISHVVRAEEHISNTPKQLLLYEYLHKKAPKFGHLPLLRNKDRSKISKRKNPVSLMWYKEQGYLPEALLNFLALLGWSHPEGKDVFDLSEFIKCFTFERVSKTGPIFDLQKLDWLNGQYIRKLSIEDLAQRLRPFVPKNWDFDLVRKVVPLEQERLVLLSDFPRLAGFFFQESLEYNKDLLIQKGKTTKETKDLLSALSSQLSALSYQDWTADKLEEVGRRLVKKTDWSSRDLFMTLRVAVSGKTATPPLFETMEVLGKEKTLRRIKEAIENLS